MNKQWPFQAPAVPRSCQQPQATRQWQHWCPHDPSASSYSTGTRKLGRVGHTGFKPPGDFLSLEKFLLSRQSLWLICTVRGMSRNPTCNALECWEGSLATAPSLSLHKHCCTHFQLPTDLGWRAKTKACLSWGQEVFEASIFLSKCIPVVLAALNSPLWLSSIWIRCCSISLFIFQRKPSCPGSSAEWVLVNFTKLKIVSVIDATLPTY